MGEVRGKHEALYPADEWKYVEIKVLKFITCQDAFDLSDHSCSIQQKLQNVEQKMLLNAFIHSRSLCEVNYGSQIDILGLFSLGMAKWA